MTENKITIQLLDIKVQHEKRSKNLTRKRLDSNFDQMQNQHDKIDSSRMFARTKLQQKSLQNMTKSASVMSRKSSEGGILSPN